MNAAIVNTYKSACDNYLNKNSKARVQDYNGRSAMPSGVYRASPISLAKAVKNDAELQGMRNSHLRYSQVPTLLSESLSLHNSD